MYKIIDNEKNVVVALGGSADDILDSWQRILRIEQERLQARYTLMFVGVDQKKRSLGLMSEVAANGKI